MCECARACARKCAEARGWHPISSPVTLHLIFFETGSLADPRATDLAPGLASECQGSIFQSLLPTNTWTSYVYRCVWLVLWVLRIYSQALMFLGQTLYILSHLPSLSWSFSYSLKSHLIWKAAAFIFNMRGSTEKLIVWICIHFHLYSSSQGFLVQREHAIDGMNNHLFLNDSVSELDSLLWEQLSLLLSDDTLSCFHFSGLK